MLDELIENYVKQLAEETDTVKQSEEFKAYLDAAAKFWRYSFHNQVLIHVQCPEASRVAGFRTWNQLGRKVKAGSRAIKILAPSLKKVEKTMENNAKLDIQADSNESPEASTEDDCREAFVLKGFVPVSVFDVSQTHGRDLPKIDVELEGDSCQPFLDKLLAFCTTQGIAVETRALGVNGLMGYSQGGKIVLDSGQSVNSQVNTLAHELAHELLHQTPEAKIKFTVGEKELQAESVAYVICKAVGLEPKSANYLAIYKADKTRIIASLETISGTAKKILSSLSGFEAQVLAPQPNRPFSTSLTPLPQAEQPLST